MILESRLWLRQDLRRREENDDLSRRIAELEPASLGGLRGGPSGFHGLGSLGAPKQRKGANGDHIDEHDDDLLDQVLPLRDRMHVHQWGECGERCSAVLVCKSGA